MGAPGSSKFEVGDLVRIEKIPSDLHDTAAIGTPEVFARALGKTFRVQGFNALGHLELVVAEHCAAGDTYDSDTIWIEPEFVILVGRAESTKQATQ